MLHLPKSLSFTYMSGRPPSYPLDTVPAAVFCINTDEVERSFVVLFALEADKLRNYLLLFEMNVTEY